MKQNKLILVLFSLLSLATVANANLVAKTADKSLPQKVMIEFSGPATTSASMYFVRNNQQYNITTKFTMPFYNMTFQSIGKIDNNRLIPSKFIDTRNNTTHSIANFNYATQTIDYGKANDRKTSILQGNSFDVISLPWQISFQPNLVLNTFQITNGKNIYLIEIAKTNINSIKSTKNIKTVKGDLKINIYDLQLLENNKSPVKFGYSDQYQNFPVYIHFINSMANIEFYVKSITVDGKKIF